MGADTCESSSHCGDMNPIVDDWTQSWNCHDSSKIAQTGGEEGWHAWGCGLTLYSGDTDHEFRWMCCGEEQRQWDTFQIRVKDPTSKQCVEAASAFRARALGLAAGCALSVVVTTVLGL